MTAHPGGMSATERAAHTATEPTTPPTPSTDAIGAQIATVRRIVNTLGGGGIDAYRVSIYADRIAINILGGRASVDVAGDLLGLHDRRVERTVYYRRGTFRGADVEVYGSAS